MTYAVEIMRVQTKEMARNVVAALRESFGTSYFRPRFLCAPAGGECTISVESDDDRAPRELVSALLGALAYDLGKAHADSRRKGGG